MALSADLKRYHRVSRTGTYGFLSALPLILLYEVMIVMANQGRLGEIRVGAEVWLKQLLALIGGAGFLVMGVLVLVVGVGIVWYERRKNIPLKPRYFAWIIVESAIYGVVVAFIVSVMVGAIFFISPPNIMNESLWLKLALSIGAGVYEELLFRVLLVGGLFLALKKLMRKKEHAYIIAALIGALIFSWVHYIGPLGDPFTLWSFTFRFLFGLALNVIFLLRGFGVAAWTHALYDVMVVTGFFA
jgi:membrane protease YdiL (CAAX protease family)